MVAILKYFPLCFLIFWAGSAYGLEDPRTTAIKAELVAFCNVVCDECGDISGAFVSTILAAAAKNDPCGRVEEAQALLDKFLTANGVVPLAQAMSHAPINVIPPAQLPGIDAPCATTLILPYKKQRHVNIANIWHQQREYSSQVTVIGGGGIGHSCDGCGSSCSLGPFMFYSNKGAGFDEVQARAGDSLNAVSFRNNNGKTMTALAGDNGSDVTTSALFTCPPGQLLTGWNAQQGCHINTTSFQCGTPAVPPLCEYSPQIEPEQNTGADCDNELNSYIGALDENAIIDAENQYNKCLYNQQLQTYQARLPFFTQNGALSGWQSNAPSLPVQIPTNPIGNTTLNCCNQSVNVDLQPNINYDAKHNTIINSKLIVRNY
ncbi:hypothetical protein BDK51DRAFT_33685 [Blyttiomyces helicus]|uniref:Uncharacterized protein n=1 Tax=Blyttiomyces helicus TaxID=388810 RepID=A0A4P9WCA5_9FUNG|nr:hypothetical protein BDK51DRAFT_33685 [Blyttiomyces helicus]|eukprot:RKO87976.1 hypothetical protein BDK51DRAFT_33685 [Blyttiomyces helicus]